MYTPVLHLLFIFNFHVGVMVDSTDPIDSSSLDDVEITNFSNAMGKEAPIPSQGKHASIVGYVQHILEMK